jgi:hypothetical protein
MDAKIVARYRRILPEISRFPTPSDQQKVTANNPGFRSFGVLRIRVSLSVSQCCCMRLNVCVKRFNGTMLLIKAKQLLTPQY